MLVLVAVEAPAAAEPGARFGMRASSRGGALDDEDKDEDEDEEDDVDVDDDEELSTTGAMVTSAAAVILTSPDADPDTDAWVACVLPDETPTASPISLDTDVDCNAVTNVSDDG